MSDKTSFTCSCGKVEVELTGPPIMTAICHCDACQAGARQLAELNITGVLDDYAGTAYVMQRKDRLKVVRGEDLLQKHKLTEKSPTNRVVATCCDTPMFVSFDNAIHWYSIYRDRLGESAPPATMRLQTKYLPQGITLPGDMPSYASFPYRFAFKLIGANIAMVLGR